MAEALAFGTSILAVIQLTASLAALSYGYISGVKRAPEDIQTLVDELRSLCIVLTNLKVCTQTNSGLAALQQLEDPLQKCKLEMENLLKKLEPKKLLGRVLTSLGWPLKEKETLDFILRMERYKSLFMLILETNNLSRSKSIETHVQGIGTHVQDIKTDVQDVKVDVHDLRNESARREDEQRRTEVLSWLYPGTSNTRHLEISSRRRKNTGLWILDTPEVQDWIQNLTPKSRLIWGYGIPGAGKTFLSSLVIDHLQGLATLKKYGVAYIYFNYREEDQQRPIDILSSLAKQLACQIPSLPTKIGSLLHELKKLQQKPTLEELYTILLMSLHSFTRTFIICDALDECNPKFRPELLPLFHRMGNDGMNLFLTSREYPEDIQESLSSSAKIKLWAKDGDIANYIEQKINDNPRAKRLVGKGNYQDKIISELTECANGMFLLVHFHIEYLCKQTTTRQLLAELERLKNSSSEDSPLNPTYDRAMEIIQLQPKTCVDLAFKILSWLVKAREVLTLHQLQIAVSIEEDQTTIDEQDLPDKMTLLDVCASLITIDEHSGTIRLAHYTVQEYLLSNPVISRDADFRVVMSCTTFLSLDIFAQTLYDKESLQARYDRYPFLDYVIRHLPSHLKDCDEMFSTRTVLRFIQSPDCTISYLQALEYLDSIAPYFEGDEYDFFPPEYPKGRTPLHMAASLGHLCSAVHLLEYTNVMVEDEEKNTAMHLAASQGHVLMVRLLLDNGADVYATDSRGRTALHCAVLNQHVEVVQLLTQSTATLLGTDDQGKTALHHAASTWNEPMIELLLEKGADILAIDKAERTALHDAIPINNSFFLFWSKIKLPETTSAAELLVEKGANVLAADKSGTTALHLAAESGEYVSLAKRLLEKGADILATDNKGKTALHHAACVGGKPMVELLLGKGASLLSVDNKGKTALHHAAKIGAPAATMVESFKRKIRGESRPIVELFLEKGASPLSVDNEGKTALHHAACIGNRSTVELLLDKGASPLPTDNEGKTVLHHAACIGNRSIVELLLDKGAEVLAADCKGMTALHHATYKGDRPTVELLLDKGANALAIDGEGMTALHLALSQEHESLIHILLEKCTDIPTADNKGKTTLHYAVSWGRTAVARSLREKYNDLVLIGGGETTLHDTATQGNGSIAELLIDIDENVPATNNEEEIVVHHAASKSLSASVIDLLLEKGANPLAVDNEGKTALQNAVSSSLGESIINSSLKIGVGIPTTGNKTKNTLHHTIEFRNSIITLLIEKGADILATDNKGMTALHYAASWAGDLVANWILFYEEEISLIIIDSKEKAALHYAVYRDSKPVAEVFLTNALDPDNEGETPLSYPVSRGSESIVELLLEKEAGILAIDNQEKTALRYTASRIGPIAEVFLKEGANPFTVDDKEETTPKATGGPSSDICTEQTTRISNTAMQSPAEELSIANIESERNSPQIQSPIDITT